VRLIVLPAVLFALFSGTAFALAKLHLAKPSASASGPVQVGDPDRGAAAFSQSCAPCHGQGGRGGGIGPRLAGDPISLAQAKAQIDNGGGAMPAGIVSGRQEEDVLAYLQTVLAPSGSGR
jgi:mono/diheme cytochrome c family protein